MSLLWYSLKSKPNKEDFLADQLLANGFKIFYPRIRVQVVNPRARKLRPYFPGYLFVQLDLTAQGLSAVHWMPGAVGLVSFGGEPASVPDSLIQAIRKRVEEIDQAGGELFDGLKPGDPVTIQEGPFTGYEAIFDARISGNDRVRVLLKLLQHRQVEVELPAGQIAKKQRRK